MHIYCLIIIFHLFPNLLIIDDRFQLMKMFDLVASCNAKLVIDCIPALLTGVQRVESRRGIGVDAAMRRRVFNLFQRLGDSGKAAIAKLKF